MMQVYIYRAYFDIAAWHGKQLQVHVHTLWQFQVYTHIVLSSMRRCTRVNKCTYKGEYVRHGQVMLICIC